MDTLQVCLHGSVDDTAIINVGQSPTTVSHAALARNVESLQCQLASNSFAHGKKISTVLTSDYAFTVTFLALTLQSCIVAPLNPGLKLQEFESYLEDFGAEVVVLSPEQVDKQGLAYQAAISKGIQVVTASIATDSVVLTLDGDSLSKTNGASNTKANKPQPTDTALVLHTSGTTGKPKAVPLTHNNIARSISNIVSHYSLTASDRSPVIMPLFHIHGIVAGVLAPLAAGSSVILSVKGGLTPSFLRDAVAHNATWYTGTPTLHKLAGQMPMKAKPNFRFIRSCSSRLEGQLMKRLEERYDCPVVEAYAMTEAAHQVCSNPISKTREGSVGIPTGVDLSIVDDNGNEVAPGAVGEVAIKGLNVMSGYRDNPEANKKSFTADGYFRTGDQGKISEDGYVTLTGRIKELINKGGEKFSPVEIDHVINQHPDVSEAVSFSIPDDMYGEDIAVAVVVNSGAQEDAAGLKSWVGERLQQAKVPKKVYFVREIPKTAVGKMQRGLVAQKLLHP